jgi:alpha-tubulin suppressor-like RCC1 family protein
MQTGKYSRNLSVSLPCMYIITLIEFAAVAAVHVYTWGRNPNDTLGHDRTRNYPEKLDLGLPSTDYITKVELTGQSQSYHNNYVSIIDCTLQVSLCVLKSGRTSVELWPWSRGQAGT